MLRETEASTEMEKVCETDERLSWKKIKLLSELQMLILKNSPYLLNDPRISLMLVSVTLGNLEAPKF